MRLFIDNLTNVDFSYLCPERGLLGETWLASIELLGELDHQGMVCDFGIVKKTVRDWMDKEIDHRLLIPSLHPGCSLQQSKTRITADFQLTPGATIATSSPPQAITLIPSEAINPTSVAIWCEQQLAETFGTGVQRVIIRFAPEVIETPYYHYSHGLKKHAGNCQRIAHGHRSKIFIWQNGELSLSLMQEWATRFQNIYLGTEEDIATQSTEQVDFRYHSQQGEFFLSLPRPQCYFMATDTTVEFIAHHIHTELKNTFPHSTFTVKAFEGISKGAIASDE